MAQRRTKRSATNLFIHAIMIIVTHFRGHVIMLDGIIRSSYTMIMTMCYLCCQLTTVVVNVIIGPWGYKDIDEHHYAAKEDL